MKFAERPPTTVDWMAEAAANTRRKRPKSDVFDTEEEKSQISTVIGGDFGERYSGGFCAKSISGYQQSENSLRYCGGIVNLKIQNSAMNEPTRLFGNWQKVAKKRYGREHDENEDFLYALERDLERTQETYMEYFERWRDIYTQLSTFYNSKSFKKRKFDHRRALRREMDRGLKAVLQMAGQSMHHSSDGSVAIVLGDCMMGTASAVGTYAKFQNYLVKKLRQLKYKVFFRSEYKTSQIFPLTEYQTSLSGADRMRIKYCRELKIHINRDVMAGENMTDNFVHELKGMEKPLPFRRIAIQ